MNTPADKEPYQMKPVENSNAGSFFDPPQGFSPDIRTTPEYRILIPFRVEDSLFRGFENFPWKWHHMMRVGIGMHYLLTALQANGFTFPDGKTISNDELHLAISSAMVHDVVFGDFPAEMVNHAVWVGEAGDIFRRHVRTHVEPALLRKRVPEQYVGIIQLHHMFQENPYPETIDKHTLAQLMQTHEGFLGMMLAMTDQFDVITTNDRPYQQGKNEIHKRLVPPEDIVTDFIRPEHFGRYPHVVHVVVPILYEQYVNRAQSVL